MAGPLFQNPRPQILDSSGDALSGGKLKFYIESTTTPKVVYSDKALSSSIGSTITLDASGRPSTDIFLNGLYKVVVTDSADSTLYTVAAVNTGDTFNMADDTTPQLGGNLDVDTFKIVSTGNNNIELEPNGAGSGIILLDGDTTIGTTTYPITSVATDQVLIGASSGVLSFGTPALVPGHIGGLRISNGTDSAHDINITIGAARDTTDAENLILSTALVKKIDANWAAGSAAGGFPSGLSLTADTTYHMFVITDGTTVDAGFDSSLTATNLLSDSSYTHYRRIASVITDASSNIINFKRVGDRYMYLTPILDIDTQAVTATASTHALTVPNGIKVIAKLNMNETSTTQSVYISDPDSVDLAPGTITAPLITLNASNRAQIECMTDTSREIRTRATGSSANIEGATLGYIDERD